MLGREHAQGREDAVGHPALTDSETGLANRLHFELVYSYLFAAGDRGMMFTVMLLSVGGPDALGEAQRRTLGQKIESTTRNSDLVAHLGDGRYVVLLLGTNLQGARIAADRVEVMVGDEFGRLSIGLAAYAEDMEESSALLDAAGRALEAAQAAGGGLEFA